MRLAETGDLAAGQARQRVNQLKQSLSGLTEGLLKKAPRIVADALPLQQVRIGGMNLRMEPRLDQPPDARLVRRAMASLAFFDRSRATSAQGGYGSIRGRVGEEITHRLDSYIEEILAMAHGGGVFLGHVVQPDRQTRDRRPRHRGQLQIASELSGGPRLEVLEVAHQLLHGRSPVPDRLDGRAAEVVAGGRTAVVVGAEREVGHGQGHGVRLQRPQAPPYARKNTGGEQGLFEAVGPGRAQGGDRPQHHVADAAAGQLGAHHRPHRREGCRGVRAQGHVEAAHRRVRRGLEHGADDAKTVIHRGAHGGSRRVLSE